MAPLALAFSLSFFGATVAFPARDPSACLVAWSEELHQTKGISREAWAALCKTHSKEESLAIVSGAPSQEPIGMGVKRVDARLKTLSEFVKENLKKSDLNPLFGERPGGFVEGSALSVPNAPVAQKAPASTGGAQGAGGLDRIQVPQPQAPSARQTVHIKKLQASVVAEGVSKEAVQQARFIIGEMLSHADPLIVENMAGNNLALYIIPKDKKLTDLPAFRSLKGKKMIDGRLFDDMRGIENPTIPGGSSIMAVAEETLLADGILDRKSRNMAHEWGHWAMEYGLPREPVSKMTSAGISERLRRARQAYQSVLNGAQGPETVGRALALSLLAFDSETSPPTLYEAITLYRKTMERYGQSLLGDYADSDEAEFFATLTAVYFDLDPRSDFKGRIRNNDLNFLMRERPELAAFMYRIYGPAPTLKGQ